MTVVALILLAVQWTVNGNIVIPDPNFKAYLVGNSLINTNGDSEIQVSEATAYTGIIDCQSMGISDLTGIACFPSLFSLNCSNNQLSSLDVSQNTALIALWCYNNQLTSLDVSQKYCFICFGLCWESTYELGCKSKY
jgi:Leucine-rich repeat (LRR) protein